MSGGAPDTCIKAAQKRNSCSNGCWTHRAAAWCMMGRAVWSDNELYCGKVSDRRRHSHRMKNVYIYGNISKRGCV